MPDSADAAYGDEHVRTGPGFVPGLCSARLWGVRVDWPLTPALAGRAQGGHYNVSASAPAAPLDIGRYGAQH